MSWNFHQRSGKLHDRGQDGDTKKQGTTAHEIHTTMPFITAYIGLRSFLFTLPDHALRFPPSSIGGWKFHPAASLGMGPGSHTLCYATLCSIRLRYIVWALLLCLNGSSFTNSTARINKRPTDFSCSRATSKVTGSDSRMKFFPPASASKPASMAILGVGIGVMVGAAALYAEWLATEQKKSSAKRVPAAQAQLQAEPAQASLKDGADAASSSINALQLVEEAVPVAVATPSSVEEDSVAHGKKRSVREIAQYYAESAFVSRMGQGPAATRSVQVESHANVSVRTMAMYFNSRGPIGVRDGEDDE